MTQRLLPSGEVTFAFTDVVGSTRLFTEHGDEYVRALVATQQHVRQAVEAEGGVVVSTEGDGAFAAFDSAERAVSALVKATSGTVTSSGPELQLRAGAHTGHAVPLGDEYVALPVHIAARVASAAAAGQVLVTDAVVHAAGGPERSWTDLGERSLRDVAESMRLWRAAGPDAPCHAEPVRRTNVTPRRTSFVGREQEFAQLRDMLDAPGLVTIIGPGGCGKTRLASELAMSLVDELHGGTWLVELSGIDNSDDIVRAVAAVLPVAPDKTDVASVAKELADRDDCLVILDNCEHVIEEAAAVSSVFVDAAPDLRMLATSREPLEIEGERVMRLRPLETSSHADAPAPASQLFLDRARLAGAPTETLDPFAVMRICSALDGLPLAVELAAGRASAIPIEELASLVEHDPTAAVARRSGEERQRSLRALVDWSLRLLSPEERAALLSLSILPGRLPRAEALDLLRRIPSVGKAVETSVIELSRRSLLDLDGSDLRLLNTIQAVAAEALSDDADLEEAVEEALVAWAADVADRDMNGQTFAEGHPAMLERMAALEPTLRAAIIVGEARDDHRVALLLRAVHPYWTTTGVPLEVRPVLNRMARRPANGDVARLRVHMRALSVLLGMPVAHFPDELCAAVEALVPNADAIGNIRDRIVARLVTSRALTQRKDIQSAEALLKEGLDLAAAEGAQMTPDVARMTLDLGVCRYLAGDAEAAVDLYRDAADAGRATGGYNLGAALTNLGEALLDLGQPREALEPLTEALLHVLPRGSFAACIKGLLAEGLLALGQVEEGGDLWREADRLLRSVIESAPEFQWFLDRLLATGKQHGLSPLTDVYR